jgi:hypothetical protein
MTKYGFLVQGHPSATKPSLTTKRAPNSTMGRSTRRRNSRVEAVINPKIAAHNPLLRVHSTAYSINPFAIDLDFLLMVLFVDPSEPKGDTKCGDYKHEQ